eukprot:CAMPEP_0170583960 /NCGR_PEP_ID=MMETSP0224-20130122/8430_1 /TAXON_ID=285029 /ORGANISM="Togula jolla, Strain CCCM 725" /LENGTH=222 /DNA_ID=CAMNT_0010907355 /DNA_START=56 /DNA_END=724 /DNA_ORIENTATION=-
MALLADILVALVAVAVPLTVYYGMFGNIAGGKMEYSNWFSWHPIFMALAFPGMMTLGRWSYMVDASWSKLEKGTRRKAHAVAMGLAVLFAAVGYLCVFKAHLPKGQFFGYDFQLSAWKPWSRVAHVWAGYLVLTLSFAQAAMGAVKMIHLQSGEKILRFHGTLGKIIVLLSAVAVLLAIYLWSWSPAMKAILGVLTILGAGFCMQSSTPGPAGEEKPLHGDA